MVMSAEINVNAGSGGTENASEVQPGGELTIVCARGRDEIEAIRAAWEQIHQAEPNPTPDADIDRFLSVAESLEGDLRPYAMLVKRDDHPVALVAGRIEQHRLEFKLGYKTLGGATLKCLTVVYGGILGQPEEAVGLFILSELRRRLRNREFDVVYFNHLRADTCLYNEIASVFGFLTRGYTPGVDDHWRMSVPKRMDDFYAGCSRKHRGNMRRYIKRIDEMSSDKENLIAFTNEDEVDDFVQTAAEISTKTYQHALGAGIVNNEQTRSLMKEAASHGWFHGCILLAGEQPCAFQLGLRYRRVYYLVSIGYDPSLRNHNPGTVLFLKVLESLCDDTSIDSIDFYFGDAEYKHRYGTESWSEASVHVFAPRLRPVLINTLRSSLMMVDTGLGQFMRKIGVEAWVKRRWRDRLQAKN
jgi:hypothetical protein